jgi:CIC family chloride channel protein
MTIGEKKITIPDWLRARFDDGQRFLVLCVVVGIGCGLAAVGFHLAIHGLFHGLWKTAASLPTWGFVGLMLAAPTFAGLVVGVAVRWWAPDAVGSGIPQTKAAYYNRGGKVHGLSGVWRFVLGALYMGLGNALGREGPTVHMSAALASRLSRWVFRDPARVQAMLPVGMAAGIGAAFNAPLSALTFVFEELLDNFSMKALGGMVVAVVLAAAICRTILGNEPVLAGHLAMHYETSAWMLVAVPLGVAAGLVGHAFVASLLGLRGMLMKRKFLPEWLRPASGGLACGVFGLSAFYLTSMFGQAHNSVFSIGYEGLSDAFDGNLTIKVLAVLLLFKFLAVVVNYSTGGSGGLFSPALFMGGMLGGVVGIGWVALQHATEWLPAFPGDANKVIGGCVLLGMGAMFGSVVRCPFTSLLIIFEMTGNYSLILPLMAGNILAWRIARRLHPVPIYDALLLQDGVSLRKMPLFRGQRDYQNLPVQAIMTHDAFTLLDNQTCGGALRMITRLGVHYHGYPVLDREERLVGVVTRHELKDHPPETRIGDIVADQNMFTLTPETPIREAANRMIARDIQQAPVVSAADPRKLLGWLTINDIARQQNAAEG